METSNLIIYGLMCPKTDEYKYIGKSKNGIRRAMYHLVHSHSNLVNNWVNDLYDNGMSPSVDIIEYCKDEDDLFDREKYWISFYENTGCNLLNKQLVGKHSCIYPLELKRDYLFSEDIVSSIRHIRKIRKISQQKLSAMSDVSFGSIKRFENGYSIGIDKIYKICDAIGLSIFVGLESDY